MQVESKAHQKIIRLLKKTGRAILSIKKTRIVKHIKTDGSLITNADIKANEILVKGLTKLFPDANIVSEENSNRIITSHTWLIDPLDGTKRFVDGSNDFCILLCLMNPEPILSYVYYPEKELLFWAKKGSGCYLESGSKRRKIVLNESEAPVIISSPYSKKLIGELGGTGVMKHVEKLFKGQIDCYISSSYSFWDICPAVLLVQEAGGDFVDGEGKTINYLNPSLFQEQFIFGTKSSIEQTYKKTKKTVTLP